MRDLDTLLTSEMDSVEWTEFRRRWIESYAKELVVECWAEQNDAEEMAEIRFEDYVGQEGWTGRDEEIAAKRCAQEDTHKYFAG